MREQYQIAQVGATLAVRVFALPVADCRPPFPSTEEPDGQELYQERRQDHGRRLNPFPGLNIGRPPAGLKHFSSQIASQRDQASMSYVIKCIKLLDYRRAIHVQITRRGRCFVSLWASDYTTLCIPGQIILSHRRKISHGDACGKISSSATAVGYDLYWLEASWRRCTVAVGRTSGC